MLKRRGLLGLFASGVLGRFLFESSQGVGDKLLSLAESGRNKLSLSLFLNFPKDKIDKNPRYLEYHDFAKWHSEIHPYLRSLSSKVPSQGRVVELGVHRGESSLVLKEVFGSQRYMGVDAGPFATDPQVLKVDIRALKNIPGEKAALVWNDVSTWEGSPRSRLAAFRWAEKNLKAGGIYIDEGLHRIPSDLDLSGFTVLHKGKNFTSFIKT